MVIRIKKGDKPDPRDERIKELEESNRELTEQLAILRNVVFDLSTALDSERGESVVRRTDTEIDYETHTVYVRKNALRDD